ncbi:MAG: S1/P1 nuclease [Bdellovibrionaceae bacterium]|nr:S1/P1 nuclease [Pseudobdellovibrionaceae bacterium]
MDLFKITRSVALSTLVGSMAFAWGDLGHQTVGEIAQRHLSGKGQRLVKDLLGNGPLAEAATFPDLVRSDEDYKEFSNFHFVEIDPRYYGNYDQIPFALREKVDANNMIVGVPQKIFSGLLGQKFSRPQKMDMMRYLVHLVGDVHQPLHVGNGYDRGGNWCDIKYKAGKSEKSSNLHSFWDSVLVDDVFYAQKEKDPNYKMPSWKGFKELADLIMADQKEMKKQVVMEAPITEWYKESQELHKKVYPDGARTFHPSEREYCRRLVKDANGKTEKDQRGVDKVLQKTSGAVAEISAEYMTEASEIVKSQIMKAGLRLAYLINGIAEKRYRGIRAIDINSKKVADLDEILKAFEKENLKIK